MKSLWRICQLKCHLSMRTMRSNLVEVTINMTGNVNNNNGGSFILNDFMRNELYVSFWPPGIVEDNTAGSEDETVVMDVVESSQSASNF